MAGKFWFYEACGGDPCKMILPCGYYKVLEKLPPYPPFPKCPECGIGIIGYGGGGNSGGWERSCA